MPACTQPLSSAHTLCRRLRDQRGQAVVEFAIVLPILMLIILGILYFGRYESYSTQMTQLAEQGARDAAVDYQPSGSQTLAQFIASQASGEIAGGSGTADAISVKVDCTGTYTSGSTTTSNACTSGSVSGDSSTTATNVTVCTQANVRFPGLQFLGQVVGAGTIYQSATMRVEQQGTGSTLITDTSTGPNVPNC